MMPLPKQTDTIMNDGNKIINGEIVYSDKVLPLKNNGEYLKVKSIYDVSRNDLKRCIKTILDSNKDVIFNTIQYTSNNTVYFYTDREINTEEWEDSKVFLKNPINNKVEIIEEIKRVLVGEKITINEESVCKPRKVKSPNSISLYGIYKVIEKYYNNLESMQNKYKSILDSNLKTTNNNRNYCVIYGFDYKKRYLRIGFKGYFDDDYYTVCFSKKNGDLFIAETEDKFHSDEYLATCGNTLSKLYDEFLKYEDYERESYYQIKPFNSSFGVNLSKHGVTVVDKIDTLNEDFVLKAYVWKKEYDYKCNSHQILSVIKGNEYIFLNNIYVNIGDCPVWMQETLYKARKDELDIEEQVEQDRIKKEQLEEENRIAKEQKQIRKLELKRKIFPWIK